MEYYLKSLQEEYKKVVKYMKVIKGLYDSVEEIAAKHDDRYQLTIIYVQDVPRSSTARS